MSVWATASPACPTFPRRVYSTWLNAALTSQFARFKAAHRTGPCPPGHHLPLPYPQGRRRHHPLLPGPANFPARASTPAPRQASWAAWPSAPRAGDAILLDIGGTTTDISLLVDGTPLLEPYGIRYRRPPHPDQGPEHDQASVLAATARSRLAGRRLPYRP